MPLLLSQLKILFNSLQLRSPRPPHHCCCPHHHLSVFALLKNALGSCSQAAELLPLSPSFRALLKQYSNFLAVLSSQFSATPSPPPHDWLPCYHKDNCLINSTQYLLHPPPPAAALPPPLLPFIVIWLIKGRTIITCYPFTTLYHRFFV